MQANGERVKGPLRRGPKARQRASDDAKRMKNKKDPLSLQNEKLRLKVDELQSQVDGIPEELVLTRKENKRLRERAAKREGIEQYIASTIRDVLEEKPLKLTIPPLPKKPAADEEVVALAHMTDLQVGKRTASYNSEIAYERMMEFACKVTRAVHTYNKDRRVRELVVFWGGDMVEGDGAIFPAQAHVVDSSVMVQATLTVPKILAETTMHWLQSFEKVRIFAVRGNHGRPGNKHSAGHPATNWDTTSYMVAKLLIEKSLEAARLDPKRVEITIAQDWYTIAPVLGHQMLLIHGDVGIKGHAGIPFYGISRKMAGWMDAIPQRFPGTPAWHHLYLGHFHQFASADVNGRMWFMGASPESDNEYARSELAGAGRPTQRLQLWTKKQLIVDLPIYLNHGYRIGGHVGPSKVALG